MFLAYWTNQIKLDNTRPIRTKQNQWDKGVPCNINMDHMRPKRAICE